MSEKVSNKMRGGEKDYIIHIYILSIKNNIENQRNGNMNRFQLCCWL